MKILSTFGAALALTACSLVPVNAADVYSRDGVGGMKDNGIVTASPGRISGFYITGTLGVSNRQEELSSRYHGEAGIYTNLRPETEGEGGDKNDETETSSASLVRTDYPLLGGDFLSREEFDTTDLTGGVELGRLFSFGGRDSLVIRPFVSVHFTNSDENKHRFGGDADVYFNPSGLEGQQPVLIGTVPVEGFLSAEKKWDGSLGVDIGLWASDRLLLTVGAGANYACYRIKGGAQIVGDTTGLSNVGYSDEDCGFGPMVRANLEYAFSRRLMLGIGYTYTNHSLSAGGSNNNDFPLDSDGTGQEIGIYTKFNARGDIDVDDHKIEARATWFPFVGDGPLE